MSTSQYDNEKNQSNTIYASTQTSGLAIAAFVISILGIHPVGLILGIIALKKIKNSQNTLTGRGLALAAVIISSVFMILGTILFGIIILVSFIGFNEKIEKTRSAVTEANIKKLSYGLMQFKVDNGRYPTEDEELIVLVEKPLNTPNWQTGGYIQSTDLPLDGWGNEFIYIFNPNSLPKYVIISYGADGKEGGKGNDKDIYSVD